MLPHLNNQFTRDGYLIIENLLSDAAITLLNDALNSIINAAPSLPDELRRLITFERDLSQQQRGELTPDDVGDAIFIIGELPRFSPLLQSLIGYAPVLDLVEAIFDST